LTLLAGVREGIRSAKIPTVSLALLCEKNDEIKASNLQSRSIQAQLKYNQPEIQI